MTFLKRGWEIQEKKNNKTQPKNSSTIITQNIPSWVFLSLTHLSTWLLNWEYYLYRHQFKTPSIMTTVVNSTWLWRYQRLANTNTKEKLESQAAASAVPTPLPYPPLPGSLRPAGQVGCERRRDLKSEPKVVPPPQVWVKEASPSPSLLDISERRHFLFLLFFLCRPLSRKRVGVGAGSVFSSFQKRDPVTLGQNRPRGRQRETRRPASLFT